MEIVDIHIKVSVNGKKEVKEEKTENQKSNPIAPFISVLKGIFRFFIKNMRCFFIGF